MYQQQSWFNFMSVTHAVDLYLNFYTHIELGFKNLQRDFMLPALDNNVIASCVTHLYVQNFIEQCLSVQLLLLLPLCLLAVEYCRLFCGKFFLHICKELFRQCIRNTTNHTLSHCCEQS